MPKRELNIDLPAAKDIFSSQEDRDAERNGAIRQIELNLIDPFPRHPYRVQDDQAMAELVASIEESGIIEPLLLNTGEDGRYTLISGHRRKHAAEILGMEAVPAYVKTLSEDEAIIAMVDANLQRPTILPSEKALAVKMKLDALKRKAGRPKANGAPEEHQYRGVKSVDVIAEQLGESREQIRRYARIADLVPELLSLLDEGKMKMRPAVELSYLSQEEQKRAYDVMAAEACTPSHAQARIMRQMAEDDALTDVALIDLMQRPKPNQVEMFKLPMARLRGLVPDGATRGDIEERLIKALELLSRYEQAKAAKEA